MAIQFVTTKASVDFSEHERFNELLQEEYKNAGLSEKGIKDLSRSIDKQAEQIRTLEAAYKLELRTAKQVREELSKTNDGKQQAKLQSELNKSESILKAMRNEAKGLGADLKDTEKGAESIKKTSSMVSGLIKLAGGFTLATIFTGAVSGAREFISASIDTRASIEQLEKTLEAISDGADISPLIAQARTLGASTEFSISQFLQLQIEAKKLGASVPEIEKMTGAIADFATTAKDGEGNSINLGRAAEITVKALNSLGKPAEESTAFIDLLFTAFNKSALSAELFSNANKFAGAAVRAVGVDTETYIAALGKLVDNNIEASSAGRGLSSILAKLGNENSNLSKFIGFSVKSGDDLQKAFEILQSKGLDLTDATSLVGEEFNKQLLILANNAGGIKELAAEYQNVEGAASRAAATIRDGITGDLEAQRSAAEALRNTIGEQLAGSYRTWLQQQTAVTNAINDFLKVPLSQEVDRQRTEFNVLTGTLVRTNEQLSELGNQSELTAEQQTALGLATDRQKQLIEEINSKYGEYLPNLLTEKSSYEDIKTAIDAANDSFRERIKLIANQEVLGEIQKQAVDVQKQIFELENAVTFFEQNNKNALSTPLAGSATADLANEGRLNAIENLTATLTRLQQKEAALLGNQSDLQVAYDQTTKGQNELAKATSSNADATETLADGAEAAAGTIAALRDRLQALKTLRDTKLNIDNTAEFTKVNKEMKEIEATIRRLTGGKIDVDTKNAIKKLENLKEEIEKLTIEAKVELAGGADSVGGLQILQEEAIKELESSDSFKALDLTDQEALVNAKTKDFAEKISKTYAGQVKEALADQETVLALSIARAAQALSNSDADLTEAFSVDSAAIEAQYRRGELSYQEFVNARKALEDGLNQAREDGEGQYLQTVLSVNQKALEANQDRIAALKDSLATDPSNEAAQIELDSRLDANEKLTEATLSSRQSLADRQVAINKNRLDQELADEAAAEAERGENREKYIAAAQQAVAALGAFFAATEERKVQAAEGNEKEIAKIRRAAAIKEKALSAAQATINGIVAVTKVIANPILAAIVGAAAALQVAAILATPIPKFRKGVADFQADGKPRPGVVKGPGTGTSDSILAWISNGESYIPADVTAKNRPIIRGLVSGDAKKMTIGGATLYASNDQDFKQAHRALMLSGPNLAGAMMANNEVSAQYHYHLQNSLSPKQMDQLAGKIARANARFSRKKNPPKYSAKPL